MYIFYLYKGGRNNKPIRNMCNIIMNILYRHNNTIIKGVDLDKAV